MNFMKKAIIAGASALAIAATAITIGVVSNSNDSDSKNNVSGNGQLVSSGDSLDFTSFTTALDNSEPTKVVTNISVYYETYEITLTYSSSLRLETKSNGIYAEYIYSAQKLNDITTSDTMYSTYTGTYYAKGSKIGEVIDNNIEWTNQVEGSLTLYNFNLTQDVFKTTPIISGKVLKGTILDDKITTLFKNSNYLINSANISMSIDDSKVSRIEFEYDTNIADRNNSKAHVTIVNRYTYNKESIEIEE